MAERILVVDDEENIRELIKFNLEKNGYQVIEAANGTAALQQAADRRPDLVLLDLMLPGVDGLTVCRRLKENGQTAGLPVIMLTARADEADKVVGLELGADDYITKPFSPRELVARVRAVLRRSGGQSPDGEFVIGTLRMNFNRYEAWLSGQSLELTPKEYEILKLLVTNAGRVYSREQLLEKIWGYEYYGDSRTVDVHIRHLRAKLENDPQMNTAIETVRGIGYRFRDI